jgi:hypothetical protein
MKLKNFFQSAAVRKVSVAALGLSVSSAMFAQKHAADALKTANQQLEKMASPALTLFMTISGLFALVGGAVVAYKLFNGDTDSAKKIGGWVGGLVVACVVSMVVKNFFFN